jgi:toxin-antitoxin system PIN domain toxin
MPTCFCTPKISSAHITIPHAAGETPGSPAPCRFVFCWTVLNAYIRITTNSRIFEHPLTLEQASARVQSWIDQPCTRIIHATERHWVIFLDMLIQGQAIANLVMDAHLAALAVEHGCEIFSADADFARFPKVKWRNPIASSKLG